MKKISNWPVTKIILILFFSLTTLVSLAQKSATGSFSLSTIPQGLPTPREHSADGVLGSAYKTEKAKEYQSILNELESRIYGLSMLSQENDIYQAEMVYYMESLVVGVIQKILEDVSKMTEYERDSLLFRSATVYKSVRYHAERLFEVMIRVIDSTLPGTSGIQLPVEQKTGDVSYLPNYRLEVPTTSDERKILFKKKHDEFLKAGGQLTEIKTLNASLVNSFSELTSVEFVAMKNGEIRVTQGSAGHIVMAGGQEVATAGAIYFVKDKNNKLAFVFISNTSGSYKPDPISVDSLVYQMRRLLKISEERIIMTKGEIMSPQIVKLLMKAQKISSEEIKIKVDKIKQTGQELVKKPLDVINIAEISPTNSKPHLCKALFSE